MIDDILAGIGGAIEGGAKGYMWGKEYQQKERALASREEIERLKAEIRQMAIDAGILRHQTPSGNTVYAQDAATDRNTATNDARRDIASGNQQVTMRGQDVTRELGIMRDATQQRGQDFNFDLGVMRDNTARRGQDITSETTRRGQDITKQLGIDAESGRATRATAANTLREQEIISRERLDRNRRRLTSGDAAWMPGVDPSAFSFDERPGSIGGRTRNIELPNGTGRPTAAPIEVKETTGTLPVAPRSPEAAVDQTQRLEQQALTLIERFRTEKDPAKQEAIRQDLRRIREQIVQSRQKPQRRQ